MPNPTRIVTLDNDRSHVIPTLGCLDFASTSSLRHRMTHHASHALKNARRTRALAAASLVPALLRGAKSRRGGRGSARGGANIGLWTGLGLMAVALGMTVIGRRHGTRLIGRWATPLLLAAVYKRLVTDRSSSDLRARVQRDVAA